MGLVADYKKRKKLETMPMMYVIQSDRKVVTLKSIRVVEIGKGNRRQTYVDGKFTPWVESTRYKFDESPYEMEIYDDEVIGSSHGYASGWGDLWYNSTFITLSEEEAKKKYEEESKRVYEKYLDPNRPPEQDLVPPSAPIG